MICPKCSSDTRVISSRPHKDDARVIQRRRVCVNCEHRFNTQEGTFDLASIRKNSIRRSKAYFERLDPAERAARLARKNLLRAARIEAAETGRAVSDILHAWNVPPPASHFLAQRHSS